MVARVSSAGWFSRAKAALALVEWLENLRFGAGVGLEIAVDSYLKWDDPAEVEEGRRLLAAYRRAATDNFSPAAMARVERRKRQAARDRRARTDGGREQDAKDAGAGGLVR